MCHYRGLSIAMRHIYMYQTGRQTNYKKKLTKGTYMAAKSINKTINQ